MLLCQQQERKSFKDSLIPSLAQGTVSNGIERTTSEAANYSASSRAKTTPNSMYSISWLAFNIRLLDDRGLHGIRSEQQRDLRKLVDDL